MFGRAVEAKKASAASQPPRAPTNKTALAKQLFSSSPSPAPTSRADIADMLMKKPHASATNSQLRAGAATEPLRTHPFNVPPPGPRSIGRKPFPSLFDKSDSFKEDPDMIHLDDTRRSMSNPSQTNNMASEMSWCEDDFTDDENLDLDFAPVSALPSLAEATTKKSDEPPPGKQYERVLMVTIVPFTPPSTAPTSETREAVLTRRRRTDSQSNQEVKTATLGTESSAKG
jgi:hypothetical protein